MPQRDVQKGRHARRKQDRHQRPVHEVLAERLGIHEEFQEIPVEIAVFQRVAPPEAGDLRRGREPEQQNREDLQRARGADPLPAREAAFRRRAEALALQRHAHRHEQQREEGPVQEHVEQHHADLPERRRAAHFVEDELRDRDARHERVDVARLHDRQKQHVVQRRRDHAGAAQRAEAPQRGLHHRAQPERRARPAQRDDADDDAQLEKDQKGRREKQKQEDEGALQVQKDADDLRVERHADRRDVRLVDLPHDGVDETEDEQLVQDLKADDFPQRPAEFHKSHSLVLRMRAAHVSSMPQRAASKAFAETFRQRLFVFRGTRPEKGRPSENGRPKRPALLDGAQAPIGQSLRALKTNESGCICACRILSVRSPEAASVSASVCSTSRSIAKPASASALT